MMHGDFHQCKILPCTLYEFRAYNTLRPSFIRNIFYNKLTVPGGRLALFLFLVFSVVFSRGGHSVTSGPLEPLNWRGSLLVDGSKDRGLSPERHKPEEASL